MSCDLILKPCPNLRPALRIAEARHPDWFHDASQPHAGWTSQRAAGSAVVQVTIPGFCVHPVMGEKGGSDTMFRMSRMTLFWRTQEVGLKALEMAIMGIAGIMEAPPVGVTGGRAKAKGARGVHKIPVLGHFGPFWSGYAGGVALPSQMAEYLKSLVLLGPSSSLCAIAHLTHHGDHRKTARHVPCHGRGTGHRCGLFCSFARISRGSLGIFLGLNNSLQVSWSTSSERAGCSGFGFLDGAQHKASLWGLQLEGAKCDAWVVFAQAFH